MDCYYRRATSIRNQAVLATTWTPIALWDAGRPPYFVELTAYDAATGALVDFIVVEGFDATGAARHVPAGSSWTVHPKRKGRYAVYAAVAVTLEANVDDLA